MSRGIEDEEMFMILCSIKRGFSFAKRVLTVVNVGLYITSWRERFLMQ